MFHHKKTKIVATIGPATSDPEIMKQIILSGVNVFRFNMKHNTHESHIKMIKQALSVAKSLDRTIGVHIVLQGPEVRIMTPGKEPVTLKQGEHIKVGKDFTDKKSFKISHEDVIPALSVGSEFLIDDGYIETKVVEVAEDYVVVEATHDCEVKHYKGVNLPGTHLEIPALTDDDLLKLDVAKKVPVDYLGYSFVRGKADIDILRFELKKRGLDCHIISKIESQTAVDNIDEIIEESDAIMVARGDLGIEVPFEQLAYIQKKIIKKCRIAHTPVITATQMLESMIQNARPTRAEATDVANAVFDGTDAVMLSGEAAVGKHPVKAVQTLSKICAYTEPKARLHKIDIDPDPKNEAELVVHAARSMVDDPNHPRVDAVVVFTETGYTAKLLARFRPERPIIAVSRDKSVVSKLQLVYGVHAVYCPFPTGAFTVNSAPNPVLDQLKEEGVIMEGEKILIVHGQFWQNPGAVNTLSIINI